MKNTETDILGQKGGEASNAISIQEQIKSKNLGEALMNEEISEEVQELRYMTYLVSQESKKYEYLSNGFTVEKEFKKLKNIENSEKYPFILRQRNEIIERTLKELYDDISKGKTWKTIEEYILSEDFNKMERRLKFGRTFVTSFQLEQFVTQVVVKKVPGTENRYLLDLYVSIYPNEDISFSIAFLKEVKHVMETGIKSYNLSFFDTFSFITNDAHHVDDLLLYVFNNIEFKKIVEYDGSYVLKYYADAEVFGENLIAKYYSKTLVEKYKNKEKKQSMSGGGEYVLNPFEIQQVREYKCEVCGKVMSNKEAGKVAASEESRSLQRDIERYTIESDFTLSEDGEYVPNYKVKDPTQTNEEEHEMGYRDMEIIKATYGKILCKDCLENFLYKTKEVKKRKYKKKQNA
ncbi:MAG: hypothetical protein EZS28_008764 [Streblomastix strix]|uniref:Uncharacterized protein n=1 Tax=Streblomastix strix TaxID=222440 RepID=A0A5J4WM64_9EUKA|nr:MAG: hypothetical protein EZS28_008764 [Streblomastix strix]